MDRSPELPGKHHREAARTVHFATPRSLRQTGIDRWPRRPCAPCRPPTPSSRRRGASTPSCARPSRPRCPTALGSPNCRTAPSDGPVGVRALAGVQVLALGAVGGHPGARLLDLRRGVGRDAPAMAVRSVGAGPRSAASTAARSVGGVPESMTQTGRRSPTSHVPRPQARSTVSVTAESRERSLARLMPTDEGRLWARLETSRGHPSRDAP